MEKNVEKKVSTEMTAVEAIEKIEVMSDINNIEVFVEGDQRKTVKRAAEDQIEDINDALQKSLKETAPAVKEEAPVETETPAEPDPIADLPIKESVSDEIEKKEEEEPISPVEESLKEESNSNDKEIIDNSVNDFSDLKSNEPETNTLSDEEINKIADLEAYENIKTAFKTKSIKEIKDVRLYIDGILQFLKEAYSEKHNSYTSLFKSKAWLGKLLGELGAVNPYETKEPVTNSKDIPPTAEVAEVDPQEFYNFRLLSDVEKLYDLRKKISEVNNIFSEIDFIGVKIENKELVSVCLTQAYVHSCESNFELGILLSKLRTS